VANRTLATRSIAVVAALGLLFGVVGTLGVSHAAGLTEKQVKSIAKKVVKKQSKKLKVKDSRLLAGQPPSAYQDHARVYSTTVSTPTQDLAIVIPDLSAGKTYQVGFSAYMSGAPAGDSYCFLARRSGVTPLQDYADDPGTQASPGCAGSAVVTMGAGETLTFFLGANGTWTTQTSPPDPIQVSVIELDSVTSQALSPDVRGTAPRGR
jgi:hypothetical protein